MIDLTWFQLGPIPANAITGTYNLNLVALSYIIAVLASYVALDLAGRVREEEGSSQFYWLIGGAFSMGAGIWSMHFIGMLAFLMPMPMDYPLTWTALSLLIGILASGFALFMLRKKTQKPVHLLLSGIVIGLGIASMHYVGMEGMTDDMTIHYRPGLFVLSIVIAILAAEVALWLALQSNQGPDTRQYRLKFISALVMGLAICGMHYVGMEAAVFTMPSEVNLPTEIIQPELLAFFIAGTTCIIIGFALTASTYGRRIVNAVQNEKEFLNAILDNLSDGIIACNSDGEITVFNRALQNNTAIAPSLAVLNSFELCHAGDKTPVFKDDFPLFRALRNETIHDEEYTLSFNNGIVKDVLINGQAIINRDGKKLGAVIAIHDITAIKKTEKMKNEFVSVVSHELRTPLTSIRGSLGLLLGGALGEFPEKVVKLLDIANKNCERLLLLINDILDMDKIQAGKMQFDLSIVDINALATDAILTNKMYCETFHVNLELIESAPGIGVHVDPARLLQVFANLISNAAKFSPEHGLITIRIHAEHHRVRVSISDKGPGIPLEFQSKIFQKFSQADSSDTRGKGGTGLGLSISKAIIEKLGGTIDFSSIPNEGTTFFFELPAYTLQEKKDASSPAPLHEKKLLICEDDVDQANYLQALLESAGFTTDIATTVAKAKEKLINHDYYAILLDLILPDQDGITFIRELRQSEKTRELPIIVISVLTETGQALLNGEPLLVLDWLDKPIDFNKLLGAISRIKPPDETIVTRLPHILHVEDDVDTQHIIKTLLEGKALVTTCSTILETMDTLKKETFDLVVLDWLLPDGKGSTLMPVFATYKLPIIVFSAFDLDKNYAAYAKKALVKSTITNDELLKTIKQYVSTGASQ